jgi:hypothetical protein
MVQVRPRPVHHYPKARVEQVLFVGSSVDEFSDMVSGHIGRVAFHYKTGIEDALALTRERNFDVVVVDQRSGDLANQLLVPLLANLSDPVKLVVISPLSEVGQYLRVPGVARVLTAPVRPKQLLRVLGLDQPDGRDLAAHKPLAKISAPTEDVKFSFVNWLSAKMMTIVSNLYKRAAFVLLGVLFTAFCFYGVLIGYFLTSSNWAAPLVLSRGHELVNRVEREIGDLHVNMQLIEQRLSEADLEATKAVRAHEDAKLQVAFAIDTINKEVIAQKRGLKAQKSNLARVGKTLASGKRQLKSGGLSAELASLYNKRLIDRSVLASSTLGMLEADQRIAALEGQIEIAKLDVELTVGKIKILQDLRDQLSSEATEVITGTSPDLLLLTKQAVDARSAVGQSQAQITSADQRKVLLANSREMLRKQIADLKTSPVARAAIAPITVLFVPYGNEDEFKVGADLYSCRLTIIWCAKAGVVGNKVDGESNAVHPFFGKPIRGFFVEALLDDEISATREIMHAKRPPFFF